MENETNRRSIVFPFPALIELKMRVQLSTFLDGVNMRYGPRNIQTRRLAKQYEAMKSRRTRSIVKENIKSESILTKSSDPVNRGQRGGENGRGAQCQTTGRLSVREATSP